MPVVIVLLGLLGFVSSKKLKGWRKIAYVGIIIAVAGDHAGCGPVHTDLAGDPAAAALRGLDHRAPADLPALTVGPTDTLGPMRPDQRATDATPSDLDRIARAPIRGGQRADHDGGHARPLRGDGRGASPAVPQGQRPWAGSPPSTRCCRGARRPARSATAARGAWTAGCRRSSGSSAGAFAPPSTSRRSASAAS